MVRGGAVSRLQGERRMKDVDATATYRKAFCILTAITIHIADDDGWPVELKLECFKTCDFLIDALMQGFYGPQLTAEEYEVMWGKRVVN